MNLRLLVAALLLLPTAAFAQGDPGPFGGLFGRTPERMGKEYRVFDIRSTGSAVYEDALGNEDVPGHPGSGAIGSVTVSGMFDQRSSRLNLRLQSTGTYHQYLQSSAVGGTSVGSGLTANFRVATRLSLEGSVNHLYTPYFQFHRGFGSYTPAGVLMPPPSPYVATVVASNTYDAIGGFTSAYSKRSTLSASVMRRETRFIEQPEAAVGVTGLQGHWSRGLSRGFRLRLGYGRERIRYAARADEGIIHESIDAGVDFERALSLSRLTTLAVTTETTAIKRPGLSRQYRLNGRVILSSWLRRTWVASVNASRLTEFMPGFIEPLFSDNVGVGLSGLFSRRVEFSTAASAGRGTFGFDAPGSRFTIANAATQLSFALTRHLAVFGQHAFNFYEVPPGVPSVAPLDRLSRQAIIVGITAWIPVVTQERGIRDSR